MRGRVIQGCIVVGLLVMAGGCATLSKEECLRGHWYDIGFTDGTRGYTQERLAQHLEACREYQVAPKREEYLQGRRAGLEHYCTPQHGYEVGSTGTDYSPVCPPEYAEFFLRSYLQGYVVYAERQVHQVRATLGSEAHRLAEQLKDADRRNRAETDTDRRKHRGREIDHLRERQQHLIWSIQEQLADVPLMHWSVYAAAPPEVEVQRLRGALQLLRDEESRLRSAIERLRHDLSSMQERWKKESKQP